MNPFSLKLIRPKIQSIFSLIMIFTSILIFPIDSKLYSANYHNQNNSITVSEKDMLSNSNSNIQSIDSMSTSDSIIMGSPAIYMNDTFVYIAEDYHGINIFDVSNFKKPKHVCNYTSHYDITNNCDDLIVQNNLVYFHSEWWSQSSIFILNFSEAALTEIANYTLENVIRNFIVDGWNLYTISSNGLAIYSFENFSPLTLIGNYTDVNASYIDFAIRGDYTYVLDSTSGLTIFDITNSSDIQKSSELILNESSTYSNFFVTETYIYMYEHLVGLHVIDITDLLHPTNITIYPMDSYNYKDIYVAGQFAYLLYDDYIDIHDIFNPLSIQLLGTYDPENYVSFTELIVQDKIAYVNSIEGGELYGWLPLYIANLTNPRAPVHIYPGDPYRILDWILYTIIATVVVVPLIIIVIFLIVHFKRKKTKSKDTTEQIPSHKSDYME